MARATVLLAVCCAACIATLRYLRHALVCAPPAVRPSNPLRHGPPIGAGSGCGPLCGSVLYTVGAATSCVLAGRWLCGGVVPTLARTPHKGPVV